MRVLSPRPLVAAVGFLTCIPIRQPTTARTADLLAAAPLFPLVGAALGALAGGTAALLTPVLPALLAATLAVALELVLTGALHADALADSADGLGGRDRSQALEIMRDHSLGAYGAAALTLDLLAKTVALAALAEHDAVLAGVVLAAAIAVATTGPDAAAPLACLILATIAVGTLAHRRIGGVTGDVMGAATELTATLALIVAAGVAI